MDMKYGQIAESKILNEAIYDCFSNLSDKEQNKFVKKFKEQPHSETQIMHTFHELVLGAYLSLNGFVVENDHKIDNKTPDWTILDSSNAVVGIIEMVNHHIDNKTNEDILTQKKTGKMAIGYRPDENDPNHNRLYSHIQAKAGKYKDLVGERNVSYVVTVFTDFKAVVDVHDIIDCLVSGEEPIFNRYPDLSGVLHFEEINSGTYYFTYIENPFALRRIDIPSGNIFKE